MEISGVIERVQRVAAVSVAGSPDPSSVQEALRSVTQIEAWCASRKSKLATLLSAQVSFPEKAIADCTRDSLHGAGRNKERAGTLDKVPEFADALDDARVTPGHVDAITKAGKNLTDEQRKELFDRVGELVDVAAVATVKEFGTRLDYEVKLIQRERRDGTPGASEAGHLDADLDRRRRHVLPLRQVRPRHRCRPGRQARRQA